MALVSSKLQIGDKVLVSIRDGDCIFFGRYPTLHKLSLIAYKVCRWKQSCIGLPQVNAPPHNADFDGDEGNGHVGENSASRLEAEACFVNKKIIGNKSGEPAVGITYNGIIGCYLLSQDDNIDPVLFHKLVTIIGASDIKVKHYQRRAVQENIPINSGRVILSMLLPPTLNYVNKAKKGSDEKDVVVKNGFLLGGKLKKGDVGDKLIAACFLIDRYQHHDPNDDDDRDGGDVDVFGEPLEGYANEFINKGYKVASFYASCRGVTLGVQRIF